MKVELLDYFGGDTSHVNVARVSYGKEASNYSENKNERLINYLVKNGHTSPFRHSTVQFRIKCPIYVERQLFKHQVGISVNSISGRYVDFSDSYYKIDKFRTQSKTSKQGSGEDVAVWKNLEALLIQKDVIDYCKKAYEQLISLGISKEQCRSVLPLSLETEFIWTGSFLALIHLLNLRLKGDTQHETRLVAKEMLELIKGVDNKPFKYSLKAFGYE